MAFAVKKAASAIFSALELDIYIKKAKMDKKGKTVILSKTSSELGVKIVKLHIFVAEKIFSRV